MKYISEVFNQNLGKFFIAEYNDEPLGIILVLYYNDAAYYIRGASSNAKRNLMPNYLLQYEAIINAKKLACITF